MYHCNEHGIDYRQDDCPRCVAQREHQEILDALEAQTEAQTEAQSKHFNPGDYQCPHCLYTTLIRNASRCPICHGAIDVGHWGRITAAEEEAAKFRKIAYEDAAKRRQKDWERTR